MAKKEPTEGEEYEFAPPDFDEEAFIHKELSGFRTTTILVIWGLIIGVVGAIAFRAMGSNESAWLSSLAIAGAAGIALKFIFPKFGADISHFGRKEWLGTGLLFFFTFMAVMVIGLNPPFSDQAEPEVALFFGPPAQYPGGDVSVDVVVSENVKLTNLEIVLSQGSTIIARTADFAHDNSHYQYTLENVQGGDYQLEVKAGDAAGHEVDSVLMLPVRSTTGADAVIDYETREPPILQGDDDHVRFAVHESLIPCKFSRKSGSLQPNGCVRDAAIIMSSGSAVQLAWDEELGKWEAGTDHSGWQPGENTFTLLMQPADQFVGRTRISSEPLISGEHTVQVTDETIGGRELAAPLPEMENPPLRQVPGPMLVGIIGSLVGIAAWRRRQ